MPVVSTTPLIDELPYLANDVERVKVILPPTPPHPVVFVSILGLGIKLVRSALFKTNPPIMPAPAVVA